MKIYHKSILENIKSTHLKGTHHTFTEVPTFYFLTNRSPFCSLLFFLLISLSPPCSQSQNIQDDDYTWIEAERRCYKHKKCNKNFSAQFLHTCLHYCVKRSIITENHGALGKTWILKYEYITETSTNDYQFHAS